MPGPTSILEKAMRADGAVAEYTIVKKGTAEDDAAKAVAATDKAFGIAQHAAADNERVNVMLMGISKVLYGGTVEQGDLLTSNATGAAIATVTASNRIIGVAMAGGVSGDIGAVLINPGSV